MTVRSTNVLVRTEDAVYSHDRNLNGVSSANALTAAAAAGTAPTKAEFDALLADVTEVRTKLNALISVFLPSV